MLTFLFALASIWTIYWLIMLLLNPGDHTQVSGSSNLHPTSTQSMKTGSSLADSTASNTATNNPDSEQANNRVATKPADIATASTAPDNTNNNSVADKHDQAIVKPLFEKPEEEEDDLKVIKGIGVVMEKTLNDLGITTFKQLASFKQAEVKMVADVLSESNAGFGDRIERDEWVEQAKSLVSK